MRVPNDSSTARQPSILPGAITRLHGGRLIFVRVVWLVFTLLGLAFFAASVPPYYAELTTFTAHNLHAPDAMKVGLAQLGIPTDIFIAYWMAVLIAIVVVYVGVGALIFCRRADDPVALFFSLTLVVFGIIWPNTGDSFVRIYPGLEWAGRFLGFFAIVCFHLLFFLFPDGRFVPRWTCWVTIVMIVWMILNNVVPVNSAFHPYRWSAPFALLTQWIELGIFGTAIYAQIYRYFRSSSLVQRQQTKWVMFSLVVAIIAWVMTARVATLPVFNQPGIPAALFGFASSITYGFAMMLIPMAIAIAVLRYRLWDIDPIINRTLVYGVLTTSIIGLYVLIVGALSAVFQTSGNLLTSLVATGIVAVLFQPLRERLQRGVNRVMYGQRDEPYAVLSRLGQRLEATLAPDAILPTIVETVREALKLPHVALALKQDASMAVATAVGTPVEAPLRVPLIYQHETVGELLLAPRAPDEPFSPADQRLLHDLARQAGIAVHAVRLTTDLQQARQRLITTREEERRRLRRDLHDGVGPTLASLAQRLDAARLLVPGQPDAAITLLGELKTQVKATITDIRRLVYALRPPVLDEFGLVSAIREHAAQYHQANGVQVQVEAPEPLPSLTAAVEVAAYRIALEALTNVVRHAHAQRCTVRLTHDAGVLCLEITDDGQGLPADYRAGVGLTSMRERAEELGGTCTIAPRQPRGTRVQVELPCPKE